MTAAQKRAASSIPIDLNSAMDTDEDNMLNVGYGIFKHLYKELELDKFFNWKTRNLSIKYSPDQIFRLLVFSRLLYPASKKETYESRKLFFEGFDGFSLDDVYHALDIISENRESLQKWIFDRSGRICERNLSVSYFDCTNYYFDIGRPDMGILDDDGNPVDKNGNPINARYRKRGPREKPPP